MGSSDSGGRDGQWWQNPKLSPGDLRQHSETWSLADDAAMATILQSISQRLVSQTHEVEESLEKALEGTDRLLTSIANTNNAFHMLANTQFIENRTNQDDADIAREKEETKKKFPPVTEEEILERCRTAIEDGLGLVTRSYERHDIQDSDTDDDTNESPLPVYALIDPYESKPLPLIIGTEAFLADDAVGLELSSSEENSRMTLSMDDTESEGELEDETDQVTLQQRAIPASSSQDYESDTDWSDEDGPMIDRVSAHMTKEKQFVPSSDDDDNMFVPSRRSSKAVDNIFSTTHNDGSIISTTDTSKAALETDSEDDGLFGQEQRSSNFPKKFKQAPNPLENSKTGHRSDQDIAATSAPSNQSGVESVRAMPDITPHIDPKTRKPKHLDNDIFGSDLDDDDGDLFSQKSVPSGLKNTSEDNEKSPLDARKPERKVPVGGVSIFGSAITSAIQRQKPSSGESSDNDDFKGPPADTESIPPPSKVDHKSPQSTSRVIKVSGKGGLFESDDEESLFDSVVKRRTSLRKDEETKPNTLSSHLEDKVKTQEEKDNLNKDFDIPPRNSSQSKSDAGLFLDDDIFSTSSSTKKNVSVSESKVPTTKESSPNITPASCRSEKSGENTASQFLPPSESEPPSVTKPVNVFKPPEIGDALFSSLSDDDDDLFSSLTTKPTQEAHSASAFVREPPPLPAQPSIKKDPVQLNSDSSKNVNANIEIIPKETSNLFTSLSDEEDLFSQSFPSKTPEVIPSLPKKEEIATSAKFHVEKISSTAGNSDSKEVTERKSNISADFPHVSSQNTKVVDGNNFAAEPSDIISDKGASIPIVRKEYDKVNSTEDKLFTSSESLPKQNNSSMEERDFSSTLISEVKSQSKSNTPPFSDVSEVANISDFPKPTKDDSCTFHEGSTDPPTESSSHKKPFASGNMKFKEDFTGNPQIGSGTLFGGKEVSTEINTKQTLLIKKHKVDDIFDDVPNLEYERDESKSLTFDDSDDLFGISIAISKTQSSHSVEHRQSPPLLSEETKSKSKDGSFISTEEKVHIQDVTKEVPTKSYEFEKSPITLSDKSINSGKHENEEVEEKISPRKKPPVGGISIFGGGVMGNNELFAKVMQRKSMLDNERHSSEEESSTEPRHSTRSPVLQTKSSNVPPSETLSGCGASAAADSHVSHHPVFSPSSLKSKSGGDENGVSFDDPTTKHVLQHPNKTRTRGSMKRRPPSRAHRKKVVHDTGPEDTQQASTSSVLFSDHEDHTIVSHTLKGKVTPANERLQDPLEEKDQTIVPSTGENKESDRISNTKSNTLPTSSKSGKCLSELGDSHDGGNLVAVTDCKDFVESSKYATNVSKAEEKDPKVKSDSIFDLSDSDEDLFGGRKQESSRTLSLRNTEVLVKKPKSDSLFEDDDTNANIFSSEGQLSKASTVSAKSKSDTKPKKTLTQSSEPFEDPLLGFLKK